MVHDGPKTPLLRTDGERGFCILWPSLVVKGKSIKNLTPNCTINLLTFLYSKTTYKNLLS